MFDALVAACDLDLDAVTATARKSLNNAVKELRDVDATPDLIESKAAAFRKRYPTMTLTPMALVKHWPSLVQRANYHDAEPHRPMSLNDPRRFAK